MKRPLGSVALPNATIELWSPNAEWENGAVVSLMPDGTKTPAAPIRGNDLKGVIGHEMAHHIVAYVMHGGSSKCLADGGKSREWTPSKLKEEELAVTVGDAITAMLRLSERLPRTVKNPSRQLTDDQVREIRRDYVFRKRGLYYFARKFGVTKTAVQNALERITYKDVE